MATSVIKKPQTISVSVGTADDIADLFNIIGERSSLFIVFGSNLSNTILGANRIHYGMVTNVNTELLDMLLFNATTGYAFLLRFNTSGTCTIKKRVSFTTFS